MSADCSISRSFFLKHDEILPWNPRLLHMQAFLAYMGWRQFKKSRRRRMVLLVLVCWILGIFVGFYDGWFWEWDVNFISISKKKSLSRFEVLSFSDIESVALPWTWSTTSYLLKLLLTHFGVPPWPLQAAGHGPFLEKRIMKQHVNKNKAMRSFMSIWRYVTSRCIDSTWLSLKMSEFYLPGISRIRLC